MALFLFFSFLFILFVFQLHVRTCCTQLDIFSSMFRLNWRRNDDVVYVNTRQQRLWPHNSLTFDDKWFINSFLILYSQHVWLVFDIKSIDSLEMDVLMLFIMMFSIIKFQHISDCSVRYNQINNNGPANGFHVVNNQLIFWSTNWSSFRYVRLFQSKQNWSSESVGTSFCRLLWFSKCFYVARYF